MPPRGRIFLAGLLLALVLGLLGFGGYFWWQDSGTDAATRFSSTSGALGTGDSIPEADSPPAAAKDQAQVHARPSPVAATSPGGASATIYPSPAPTTGVTSTPFPGPGGPGGALPPWISQAHQTTPASGTDRWRREVPPVLSYVGGVPTEAQSAWSRFQEEFPEVDPTELEDFHHALLEKRQSFGEELTDEAVRIWHDWLAEKEPMQVAMVRARGEYSGWRINGMDAQGNSFTLIGFQGTTPIFTTTQNAGGAMTTGADRVRMNPLFDVSLGPEISGAGHYININDHGTIYEHTEFQLPDNGGSRIVVKEINDSGNRNHMTHVAGTMTAWGYNASLMGMAPRTWMRSLIQQYMSHITGFGMKRPGEMLVNVTNPRTGQPSRRSILGSTSLGSTTNNQGIYTSTTAILDSTLRDFPFYTHFYAAGNDGGGGFATLSLSSPVAKNVITIGAIGQITRDAEGNYVSGGSIAGFSSRGPTLDGRIKPDLVSKGTGVLSTTGTTGSTSSQGTSMATPMASGSTILLIDYFTRKFSGNYLRAASIKALLINTAEDRGNVGPDYIFGWGVANVYRAASLVRAYAENPSSRTVVEDTLHPTVTRSWTYTRTGDQPIRVTLAWHDLAGVIQSSIETDRSPRLVHDLNLRVTGPDGTVHVPFVMPFTTGQGATPAFDPSLFNAVATTGNNVTDNVEQVLISSPAPGNYTITIAHAGTVAAAGQDFSLAVTGLERPDLAVPTVSQITPTSIEQPGALPFFGDELVVEVIGEDFLLGSTLVLRREGETPLAGRELILRGLADGGMSLEARFTPSEFTPGYYDVVVRNPDGTEGVLSKGFFVGGYRRELTAFRFEGPEGLTLDAPWAIGAPGMTGSQGPSVAAEGQGILATNLSGAYTGNLNASAVFPALNTTGYSGIRIRTKRWLDIANGDTAFVEYSIDGSAWHTVASNGAGSRDWLWTDFSYDLPAGANEQSALRIRFRLQTNSTTHGGGISLDDLLIDAAAASSEPPEFTSTPPAQAPEAGQFYSYSITFADPDTPAGDLALSAPNLPAWLTLSRTGANTATLSGTFPDITPVFLRLQLTDGTFTVFQELSVNPIPQGGNTPPVFVTQSLPLAHEGHPFSATIEATDADGQPLALSMVSGPGWLALADSGDGSGTLSGQPPGGAAGDYALTLSVADGLDTTETELSLTVVTRDQIGFVRPSESVIESVGTLVLEVQRVGSGEGDVQVHYATQAGTAVAGSDFVAASGSLFWASGDLSPRTINLAIMEDGERELMETFTVQLSNISGPADISASTLTVSIADNDVPPLQIFEDASAPFLLEHGAVSESNGVFTLTRTGETPNAFQGYAFSFAERELVEVGDAVEVSFRIRSNAGNNSARTNSWGFFQGDPVTAHGQRAITDTWEGFFQQLGSRSGSGTTGALLGRQGTGANSLMDHTGGSTANFDGGQVTPSMSAVNQSILTHVTLRIERVNLTQVRLIAHFASPDSNRSASGTNQGISWSYETISNQTVLQSTMAVPAGGAFFNGFSVASRGNNWVLQDVVFRSNVGVPAGEPDPWQLWLSQFFTAEQLEQPANEHLWDSLADPDGDGIPNLLEYALGGNPLVATTQPLVVSEVSNLRMQLSFLRAQSELEYLVEASSDLVQWHTIATNPGEVGQVVIVEDAEVLSPASRRFLRLRVRQPAP